MLTWWNCPIWWCYLMGGHVMNHRFANYNTDAAGKRCGCGYKYADDDCITENQQEKGYILATEKEQIVHISDQPIPAKSITINMEQENAK